MLRLNGYAIPIASGSIARSYHESVVRASRQMTGQYSADRQGQRRRWDLKTAPMTFEDFCCLKDWIYSPSWVWSFESTFQGNVPVSAMPAGTATNVAYLSNVGADAASVVGGSKFGTYSGAVMHTVTNLYAANIANGTETSSNTTGFTAVASASISSSTAAAWTGTRSLKVDTTAAADGFQTATVSVSNGAVYYGSFYVRSAAGKTLAVELIGSSTITTQTVVTTGSWQRVVIGGTMNTTTVYIKVTQVTASTGTHYFDGFQMESTYRSPWVATSRGSNSAVSFIPNGNGLLGCNRGMTLHAWVTPTDLAGAMLFDTWDYAESTSAKVYLENVSANTLRLTVIETGGTTYTLSTTGFTWPASNDFTMVTAVVRPYAGTNSYEMAIYINGVLNNSSSPGVTLDCSVLDRFWIGNTNGAFQWSGTIDNLVVFPYPLGPTCIAGLYSWGSPVPIGLPELTAEGDMIADGPTTVIGAITSTDVAAGGTSAGVFHANRIVANLTFEEV